MKKKILLSSLLVLSIVGCTSPILNNTSQYSDLDKEYSQFKTQALTQSYLKKKMDKWISDSKYSKNLVREIEYAKFKHPALLKDILVLQPTMYNSIISNTNVNQKRSEPNFENFIEYIDPFPSDVTATSATNITSTSFTANWNSVANATGYKLYIDGIPITLGNVTSYNKTGLVDGSSYNYYVKATNSAGESSISNTINVTLPSALPIAPTATNATDITETSFTANWNAVTGATAYKLYIDDVEISLGIVTSYIKTGLTAGTSHNYYVKATNSAGDSSISNIITLSTPTGEFRVNTYTTEIQRSSSIAMANDGKFVITWHSSGQDGSSYGVYAQKYNADGSVNGSEFRVNTYTTGNQYEPSIAMANDGKFIITWYGEGQGDTGGIFAQKYNADGSTNGSNFLVNSYTTYYQENPSIAISNNGSFIISWNRYGNGDDEGIFAQKYNADGSTNGSNFLVNTYTTNTQEKQSVAISDNGSFVISWQSVGQDGDSASNYEYNVYAQKYNANGSVNGSEFKVNTYTTNNQSNSSVSMDGNGNFIISWQSSGQDGNGIGIYAQKYNADGSVNGSEFRVNTYTTGAQQNPLISIDTTGNFIITWNGNGIGDLSGIYAQRFNSSGTKLGSEFLVNSYTTNNQMYPEISINDNGYFVISWEGCGLGDSSGIFAKRFDSSGNVL